MGLVQRGADDATGRTGSTDPGRPATMSGDPHVLRPTVAGRHGSLSHFEWALSKSLVDTHLCVCPDSAVRCGSYDVCLVMDTRNNQVDVMNAQEMATHLGVTERTVRRWIERGELVAEKRGRSFVIRREDGETVRLRALGPVASERADTRNLLQERDRELARLEGRYDELRRRVAELESQLDSERRRAVRLELERETRDTRPAAQAA